MSEAEPSVLAMRAFLLRKNLASLPFELTGALVAFSFTNNALMALAALLIGDLIGDQVGRRIAHGSGVLHSYTVDQIRTFKDHRWLMTWLILAVPLAVFLASWLAGVAIHQSLALAGVGWSLAALIYRYWSHIEAQRSLNHA